MEILISYSRYHFDPTLQKLLGTSASWLASALYDVLKDTGSVTYIDCSDFESVRGKSFDLFVGISQNFHRIVEICKPRTSILFAVNMHPAEKNRRVMEFATAHDIQRECLEETSDLCVIGEELRSVAAADYIFCVGNGLTEESYLRNGVRRDRIKTFNYETFPLAETTAPSELEHRPRRFVYATSMVGLRKGADILIDLFTDDEFRDANFHLDIAGSANIPRYDQGLIALRRTLGERLTIHGFVASGSDAYLKTLNNADFLIFPSIEEGQAGTVVDALSQSCIPLITDACGIDFAPLGYLEQRIGSERNRDLLRRCLQMSAAEIDGHKSKTHEYYAEFHLGFRERLQTALADCLAGALYPKVSIVLAIFNKEKTIRDLLTPLDLACREYGNVEMNIIFDGCEDKTEPIVRQFFSERSCAYPVTYEVTPNIFEVRSNNIGLRKSTGKYAVIVQDDNLIRDKEFLFEGVAFLERTARCAVLGGLAGVNFYPLGTTGLQGPGQILMSESEVYWRQDAETNAELARRTFQVDACMRGPLFFRKSFLDEHGYLDEAYAPLYEDDMDICIRAASLSYKVYCILMDVENLRLTMSGYDQTKRSTLDPVLQRNKELFYRRWKPSTDKNYLWLHRTVRSRNEPKSLSTLVGESRWAAKLHKIGRAAAPLARAFDSAYCENLSDSLWKRRTLWVQTQAAMLPSGSCFLEIGAGAMPYKESFAHCQYMAYDFFQSLRQTGASTPYTIPLPDESFDAILCSEVFEHIPDPIDALREVGRLLKPGGKLIFSAPVGSGQHRMPRHYYGGFTRSWYEKFFPKYDLEIDTLIPNGGLYGHAGEMLSRTRPYLVGGLEKRGVLGRMLSGVAQVAVINLPTVVLWEMEKRKIAEDFTVCFFCTAHKKAKTK